MGEAVFEECCADVGQHADLARKAEGEAEIDGAAGQCRADHFALQGAGRDRKGAGGHCPGQRRQAACLARKECGMGQHAHAAERGADRRVQGVDAEVLDGDLCAARDVLDPEFRPGIAVGAGGRRVDVARAGRAEAAAERVRADDEIAVGIEGLARSDQVLPPARGRILGGAGGVRRRGQAGEQQDGVVVRGVQGSPGFDREACRAEFATGLEAVGVRQADAVLAAAIGGRRSGRLGVHGHHCLPQPLRRPRTVGYGIMPHRVSRWRAAQPTLCIITAPHGTDEGAA